MGITSPTPMMAAIASPHGLFRDEGSGTFTADIYNYFAALVAGVLDIPERRTHRKDTILTFNYAIGHSKTTKGGQVRRIANCRKWTSKRLRR
jgi:hypothetical protein